jgi:hypothetical protein
MIQRREGAAPPLPPWCMHPHRSRRPGRIGIRQPPASAQASHVPASRCGRRHGIGMSGLAVRRSARQSARGAGCGVWGDCGATGIGCVLAGHLVRRAHKGCDGCRQVAGPRTGMARGRSGRTVTARVNARRMFECAGWRTDVASACGHPLEPGAVLGGAVTAQPSGRRNVPEDKRGRKPK